MDTVLVLLAIGLLATFHLMSVITLKNRLESLQKGIDKLKTTCDYKANKVVGDIKEIVDGNAEKVNRVTKQETMRLIYALPKIYLVDRKARRN
ncbi:hypothetical protein [Clostridium culturomicium]|uniref:hypothetical protein n=1 Tax=Clostridium culturomicium TaxID=1499683 RepID=UPI00058F1728|nr:hypothetical protein [Clostridium culturomicium]